MNSRLGYITSVEDIVAILREGRRPTTEADLDAALVAMIQLRTASHTPAALGTWVARAMQARELYLADLPPRAVMLDSNLEPSYYVSGGRPDLSAK